MFQLGRNRALASAFAAPKVKNKTKQKNNASARYPGHLGIADALLDPFGGDSDFGIQLIL